MRGVISGGSVLFPGEQEPRRGDIGWVDDEIAAVTSAVDADVVIDASGCVVLPGVIDLHGDAFERSLMPRGGVPVPLDVALDDNDAQLLAAGITTSFLSATDSWEPGLRSRETLRELVEGLRSRRAAPRVLLHVRHERCLTDDFDELLDWVADGSIQMLSYNDHTPGGIVHVTGLSAGQVARSGVSADALGEMQNRAVAQRDVGLEQEVELSRTARSAGVPTASHDPSDLDDLARDLDLGITFVEFPLTIELAQKYRDEQVPVLLGAPNLVRGGSHLGNLSVRDAVEAGAADLLCSDYHYPSLLQAPFVAADEGLTTFDAAWRMVSAGAAEAAGLDDRGELAPGMLADVIVVERHDGTPPRVRAVVVGGDVVYQRR